MRAHSYTALILLYLSLADVLSLPAHAAGLLGKEGIKTRLVLPVGLR